MIHDCRPCKKAMKAMKDAGIWRKMLVTLKGRGRYHWARLVSERTIRMGLHIWSMKTLCGKEFDEEVDSSD